MLEHAIEYIDRDWRVFPVHGIVDGQCTCRRPECSSPGKHPHIRNWPEEATADRSQIRKWWKFWPDANVAITTGGGSGIVVLDVDPRNGGDESLHALIEEHGEIPETLTVTTGGGGRHFYLSSELAIRGRRILPGLDFKGEGGYVVAPNSLHVSGQSYAWDIRADPAPLPSWLLQLIQTRESEGNPSGISGREPGWVERALRGVHEGERNETAASLAGYFFNKRLPEMVVLAILIAWNNRNPSPLDSQEIHRTVASIQSTHLRDSPNETERIELVSFADILDMPEDTTPPIIADILYPGESLLITGPTGIGKSTMALDLSLSLGTGQPFLGQYEISESRRVLLIQSENGFRTFRDRLQRMTHDWSGKRAEALSNRLFTPWQNGNPIFIGDIADRQGRPTPFMDSLKDMIERYEPHVIFFDPLSTYHGASSENENADMRRRLDRLSVLSHEYGLNIVVIHHHSKSPHEGLNKSRGATAITDWPSAILTLTKRNPRGTEGRYLIRAKWTKVRSFATPEPLTLEMIEGATFRQVDVALADVSPEDVVTLIQEAGGSFNGRGRLVEAIQNLMEVGRDRAERALSAATRTGLVISERDPDHRSRRIFSLPEDERQPDAENLEDLI